MNRWQRFKAKWHIRSDGQALLILIVFALTGSASAWLTRPLIAWLGWSEWPWYWRVPVSLVIILPVYNLLLLLIGGLLGQFVFFWQFQKRTWNRLRGHRPTAKD